MFAINAYCPITDLGNADVLYEWLFTVLNTRADVNQNPSPATSAAIAAQYPAYQASLGLRNLTAQNMLDAIKAEVIRSAEIYLRANPANTIPALGENFVITGGGPGGGTPRTFVNDWIDVDNATDRVRSVDMKKYIDFVARQQTLKPAPAFDQIGVNGLTGGETNLFGPYNQRYLNFTQYAWDNNTVAGDGSGRDDTGLTWAQYIAAPSTIVDDQVRLVNPMAFIGTTADTAPNWYVRHGTRDRDTAFIVSINLDRALDADGQVQDLDYHLAWNQPHAGNYDVPEAMAWISKVVNAAGDPLANTAQGEVGGTVPATLSLTLGTASALGPFVPGVAKDYESSVAATVTSSAGNATLSVVDSATTAPGRLVNGAFALAQPLQAAVASAFAPVSATPLALQQYTGPVANDAVTVRFKQSIGANEGLRTGSYAKSLTFTLSTTEP